MPLVIALVVLPTASSSVRICAPSPSTSPDISAMPWALSLTGPKVSIATITPDRGQQAAAGERDQEQREVERRRPSRNAPQIAAAMITAV